MYTTNDFFISYGRRESLGFVARLHRALILEGYTGWFDKVNIPDGEAYDKRISNGIESSDNFVFVMAPRCLTSPYCLIELEYARVLGKRIIPINQMVIFKTESQELSAEDQAVLKGFYKANGIPDPNITTAQQVLDRSLAVVGTTDWLDGKQNLSDDACEELRNWAATYENSWHRHEEITYLEENDLPTFGQVTDATESIVERIKLVAEKHKSYVQQHTQLTLDALHWANNQRSNNHLLVGKERKTAEEWLLTEFTPPKQPPCQPSSLLCEFIGEARKNAENRMTDAFICSASGNKSIREQLIQALLRYAVTSWSHETDIQNSMPYEEAIRQGIEGADNFFFLISPESVASEDCQGELVHALQYNKRIVPILVEKTEESAIPETLRSLQYIDFTDNQDQGDFLNDIDDVLNVLNHEKSYYEEHKVLLTRALQWDKAGRRNSFLLRGFNLENARIWLQINDTRSLHPLTDLHHDYIKASEATKGQLNTDVFVSYSRKDGDFARDLNRRLQENGKNTWFDQESISSGVDFEKEIFKGIEGADNIVFVLSPDSVQSEYCEREVEYAAKLGKRFITILCRETDPQDMPEVLRVINWIDFTIKDKGRPFGELMQELELDREHAHQHTVLQQRALEWDKNQQSPDYLLNNSACQNALSWIEEADGKNPLATPLQKLYIQKSQIAIEAAEKQEQVVSKTLRRRLVINRVLGTFSVVLLVSAILASIFAYVFIQSQVRESEQATKDLEAAEQKAEKAIEAASVREKEAQEHINEIEAKEARLTTRIDSLQQYLEQVLVNIIPEVIVTSEGKPVDTKIGVPLNTLKKIQVKATLSSAAKSMLQGKYSYRVAEYIITLARGRRAFEQNTTGEIGLLMNKARPGDRLVIEVRRVMRISNNGNEEVIRELTGTVITIPLS